MSCVVCYESHCMCRPKKVILIKKSLGQVAHTDIYKKAAAEIFNVPYEAVTPEQRSVGKLKALGAMYAPDQSLFRDETGGVRRYTNPWPEIKINYGEIEVRSLC